jgi:hypothetical protein
VVGLAELFVFRYDFTPGEMWLCFKTEEGEIRRPAGGDTRMRIPQRKAERSLRELVSEVMHHANFVQPAMESFVGDVKGTMEPEFSIHPVSPVTDEIGCRA